MLDIIVTPTSEGKMWHGQTFCHVLCRDAKEGHPNRSGNRHTPEYEPPTTDIASIILIIQRKSNLSVEVS